MELLIITFCRWQKTQDFNLNENCSEVRGTGIKTKHILINLHGKVLWLTLNKLQVVCVCVPWVACHLSYLCLSLVHTFVNMLSVTVATTLCIFPVSSCRVVCSGGIYAVSSMCPPVKDMKWGRSCYRWQSNRDASTNPFLWKLLIQEVPNCNMKCWGAPPCWNSITMALVFWKNGRWDSSTLFTYTMLVTVLSAKRKVPIFFFFLIEHKMMLDLQLSLLEVFSHCMWIVGPSDSNHTVNMP